MVGFTLTSIVFLYMYRIQSVSKGLNKLQLMKLFASTITMSDRLILLRSQWSILKTGTKVKGTPTRGEINHSKGSNK